MRRRQFIAATTATGAIGLAGCTSLFGGEDSTSDPEEVSKAFHEAADPDEAMDLLHPAATSGIEEEYEAIDEFDVEVPPVVDTEVLEEDLDADEMQEQFIRVDEETAETVADLDNALTRVTVEHADGESDSKVLTAEDDGEWLVVESMLVDF